MKKLIPALLLSLSAAGLTEANAKDGYRLTVKIPDTKDTMAYLAHYYGKPLPTIYKSDSARIKNGVATFKSDSSIIGGIYMILLSDKKTYFEFLLDNGNEMTLSTSIKDLEAGNGVKFKGSPENDKFLEYTAFLNGYGKKQQVYMDELSKAKTATDTAAVNKKFEPLGKELTDFRKDFAARNPQVLISKIFNAMEAPSIPEKEKYKADGKTLDTAANIHYYKAHYWDKFDFSDERLTYTPIYEGKLEEYFNRLTVPSEDSMIKESTMLLSKARASKEVFKYSLWWLTKNAESSKIMGMDAVFVYLVENYYMKGDAFWVNPEQLSKYIDRAHKIAPNVIGNLAPELKLPDQKGVEQSLLGLKAKYTLVLFWAPDCGHCQKEIPVIDSVYKAVLKDKGLRIYAVRTEEDTAKFREIVEKNNLSKDWIHVSDPARKSRFRQDYDIYSTPVIYLLDEKKIIRGKRIDHSNLAMLIDMLEKKEEREKKNTKASK